MSIYEDSKEKAWEAAFDEDGHELLCELTDRVPVPVLQALLTFCEVAGRYAQSEIEQEQTKLAVGNIIRGWIEDTRLRLAEAEQEKHGCDGTCIECGRDMEFVNGYAATRETPEEPSGWSCDCGNFVTAERTR